MPPSWRRRGCSSAGWPTAEPPGRTKMETREWNQEHSSKWRQKTFALSRPFACAFFCLFFLKYVYQSTIPPWEFSFESKYRGESPALSSVILVRLGHQKKYQRVRQIGIHYERCVSNLIYLPPSYCAPPLPLLAFCTSTLQRDWGNAPMLLQRSWAKLASWMPKSTRERYERVQQNSTSPSLLHVLWPLKAQCVTFTENIYMYVFSYIRSLQNS